MTQRIPFYKHPFWRILGIAMLTSLALSLVVLPFRARTTVQATTLATNACQLGNGVKHVIYIQFDNVHLTRDNPNVPSDLEQMPNLLNFMKQNGVVLSDQHTPLIAHTANDIVTSMTGLYPDNQGLAISNSYRYYNPNGTTNPAVDFAYWTDPVYDYSTSTPTDTSYNLLTASGKNTPAPWVPYTRAGCNVGGVATANIELENIATDIPTVFGPNSPQAQEVASNPAQATADFVGIAVHCAKSNSTCASTNGGVADTLPDEPGGYHGYQALFGHKYVAPLISPNGPLTDLDGNPISDGNGHVGFPGFNGMSASVSLSYAASMQEHGIPVTYSYISDAHDNNPSGGAFGPGQAGYVQRLAAYNAAFGKFFTRLSQDGINSHNTLFVVTSDENDHFVGGAPSPANCDGVTVPCTYSQIGEIDGNLTGLLATQQGVTTPFTVHSDSAPGIYITGNPARDNQTVTRPFDQALGKLTATNPITGKTDQVTNYLADSVEMNLLHMVTGDPARTPTITQFANPNYYLYAGAANCNAICIQEEAAFAWNHGDVSPDINRTWLGMVGPDVQHLGIDGKVWSDHTDTRPTMMELLGLHDDYQHEGRVLFEIVKPDALPSAVREHEGELIELSQIFKQINAPVGELGLTTLNTSTVALESSSPNDSTYTGLENQLLSITQDRNSLVKQMLSILEKAEFGEVHGGQILTTSDEGHINELIKQAQALLNRASKLA